MKNVLVCGVGAIGSNLAAYLASDVRDEHKITVLDRDNIEERNIRAGTQFYLRDQIGSPKVEALQFNIHKFLNRQIEIINLELTQSEMLWGQMESGKYDLIIDCFDNWNARSLVQEAWRQRNVYDSNFEVVHLGFSDKFTFAIEWTENYNVPEDNPKARDLCELPGASSFVHMVASIGSLTVQEFLTTGKKKEFVGNKLSVREVL